VPARRLWVIYEDDPLIADDKSAAGPALNEFTPDQPYSIAVFVLGGLFFRHLKRGFADVL